MSTPVVSILLPVHNGGPMLRESVESLLHQTWTDWELVAVNDGSTDGSGDVLRSYADSRIRVLDNPENMGLIASLNRGLAACRGELVARQDADDVSHPERLALQVRLLKRRPDLALLGSAAWRIDIQGNRLGAHDVPCSHRALLWALLFDNPFVHTSVLFRKSVVCDELGGYHPDFVAAEDYDLWARIAARYPVANLAERLVFYREHGTSITRTRFAQMNQASARISARISGMILPELNLGRPDFERLARFRLRFPAADLPGLRNLMARMLDAYRSRYPAKTEPDDLDAVVCRQVLRLGAKFLQSDRLVAVQELGRAFRISPREWLRQAVAAVSVVLP